MLPELGLRRSDDGWSSGDCRRRLSLAVPITPSGLGVQEGAAAVLFGSIGLAPGVALAALLLARLSLVLTTLIGVALLERRDVVVPPRTASDVAH